MPTTDKDLGMMELLRQLSLVDDAYVDIGLFDEGKHPESDFTTAQIGAVHEFGSSIRHGRSGGQTVLVPERPWLRTTHDEKQGVWQQRLDDGFNKILEGRAKVLPVLTAFGERAAGDVRRKITAIKTPGKADSTLRTQGARFNNPLIFTGFMRAAVRSQIVAGYTKKKTPKGRSTGS